MRLLYYPLTLFLVFLGLKNKKKVYDPVVLTDIIWFLMPALYDLFCLLNDGYKNLTQQFFLIILIYICCFHFFYRVAFETRKINLTISIKFNFGGIFRWFNISLFSCLALICNIIYIFLLCKLCNTYNPIELIKIYRIINLTQPEKINWVMDLFELLCGFSTGIVCCLLLYCKRKYVLKSLLFLVFFLIPVLTASKAGLLQRMIIFLSCLITSGKKNKIKIVFFIVLISILLAGLIVVRDVGAEGSIIKNVVVYIIEYAFLSLPALSMVLDGSITVFKMRYGERTLYFWYLLLSKFGLTERPVRDITMYYLPSPDGVLATNVFSAPGLYFIDFGIIGIIIYSFLISVVAAFIYKRVEDNEYYRVLYMIFLGGFIFQFFGDLILVYFVSFFENAFLLYIVFKITNGERINNEAILLNELKPKIMN